MALVNAKQLAEELYVSTRTIARRVAERSIPYHKVGHTVRFNVQEVLAVLEVKPVRRSK